MPDLLYGPESLSADVNKVKNVNALETKEGAVSQPVGKLDLEMDDEELLRLKKRWETMWSDFGQSLKTKRDNNEKYWKGRMYQDMAQQVKNKPIEDNEIFEAVETFIPFATKANPDAVVTADNTSEGIALCETTEKMLKFLADRNKLKLQLKQVTRHWLLYYLGAIKTVWDARSQEIGCYVVRPQRLILDPNSTIENGIYDGEYVGEFRNDLASVLIERFPKKQSSIMLAAKGQEGTMLRYMEWWTDDYVFWTLKDEVLGKSKNPHWNYETVSTQVDAMGAETQVQMPGKNHFAHPKKPYDFLSVFNLGQRPFDDTSLVEQVITTQERITKRYIQIDKNVDNMNSGLVLSGRSFTKEQAANASDARRRGAAILVPNGDVNEAIKDIPGTPLPGAVFQDLLDSRQKLKGIFGTSGLSPQAALQDRTVRGKMFVRQQDTDRIGGLFTEYLEQLADGVYNQFVQFMHVYYDEPHTASIVGKDKSFEFVTISSENFDRKLSVTVKEGSLVPKDSMSKRDEAVQLWNSQALDPISLFEALDYPNPREQAKNLYLWRTNPAALFPELQPSPPPGLQSSTGPPPGVGQLMPQPT